MAIKSTNLSPSVRAMIRRQDEARASKARQSQLESITVTLRLPSKVLSPNWRGYWYTKAREARKSREAAAYRTIAALNGRRPLWKRSSLRATFYHAQRRRRDDDNLIASLKSARDGLVDAGLLDDDAGVTTLPPIQLIDRDRPRVELTITREPETP